LTGPNGSGKSTLLGALLGRIPLRSGDRYVGPGVVVGELEQARDALRGPEPLLEVFRRLATPAGARPGAAPGGGRPSAAPGGGPPRAWRGGGRPGRPPRLDRWAQPGGRPYPAGQVPDRRRRGATPGRHAVPRRTHPGRPGPVPGPRLHLPHPRRAHQPPRPTRHRTTRTGPGHLPGHPPAGHPRPPPRRHRSHHPRARPAPAARPVALSAPYPADYLLFGRSTARYRPPAGAFVLQPLPPCLRSDARSCRPARRALPYREAVSYQRSRLSRLVSGCPSGGDVI